MSLGLLFVDDRQILDVIELLEVFCGRLLSLVGLDTLVGFHLHSF
jgi:hypothetical protein